MMVLLVVLLMVSRMPSSSLSGDVRSMDCLALALVCMIATAIVASIFFVRIHAGRRLWLVALGWMVMLSILGNNPVRAAGDSRLKRGVAVARGCRVGRLEVVFVLPIFVRLGVIVTIVDVFVFTIRG
jgi:hypothetical protein